MKRVAIWIILLSAIVLSGCEISKGVRLRVEGDRAVDILIGQTLEIELEANPTTGYRWELEGPWPKGVLRAAGTEYSSPSRLIGASGIRIFRFEGSKEGQVELVFAYRRPWEDKEPLKRHVVRVTVH